MFAKTVGAKTAVKGGAQLYAPAALNKTAFTACGGSRVSAACGDSFSDVSPDGGKCLYARGAGKEILNGYRTE